MATRGRPKLGDEKRSVMLSVAFTGPEGEALQRLVGVRIMAGKKATASSVIREALERWKEYQAALAEVQS